MQVTLNGWPAAGLYVCGCHPAGAGIAGEEAVHCGVGLRLHTLGQTRLKDCNMRTDFAWAVRLAGVQAGR